MIPSLMFQGVSKRYIIGTHRESFREKVSHPFDFMLKRKGTNTGQRYLFAIKDVSFEVYQGEVLGIIGSNGAGKTTTLKLLSKVTQPTFGKITTRGRIASLIELGAGFHPELTGRENIYLNGTIMGLSRSEINKKFDQIVAFAELEVIPRHTN